MRSVCLLLVFLIMPSVSAGAESPVRFGLTAVVVTENLRFLDQLSDYLGARMGREVELVMRKSYREVMDLLDSRSIDFAWICGFPYIQMKEVESARLLNVPVYRGKPSYHSYIIVPANTPYKHFEDLKGKVFAFSDPDSNSGFLYPISLLARNGDRTDSFFRRTFFTFNHAETVQAVAEQFADGGAVDSYIWEYLASFDPELTKRTRIIQKSPSFGFPPIVSRAGLDQSLVMKMKAALENMDSDIKGKRLLSQLKLDGFREFPDSIFHGIRAMANRVELDESTRQVTSNE